MSKKTASDQSVGDRTVSDKKLSPSRLRNFRKSRTGIILGIGGQAIGVFGIVREIRTARTDRDRLKLIDATLSALSVVTSVALLVRELRRAGDDDVLAEGRG